MERVRYGRTSQNVLASKVPLASARNYAEAVALCTVENLRWVCWRHNPRGRRDSAGIEASA